MGNHLRSGVGCRVAGIAVPNGQHSRRSDHTLRGVKALACTFINLGLATEVNCPAADCAVPHRGRRRNSRSQFGTDGFSSWLTLQSRGNGASSTLESRARARGSLPPESSRTAKSRFTIRGKTSPGEAGSSRGDGRPDRRTHRGAVAWYRFLPFGRFEMQSGAQPPHSKRRSLIRTSTSRETRFRTLQFFWNGLYPDLAGRSAPRESAESP